jgi:inosose dehydratase
MPLAKLGIAPIAWWNDDLPELSDDVSLDECMAQARRAGFTGMETGRRFPMDADELRPVLEKHGMGVCGGWFSGLLLDGDIETEKDRIADQMALFKAVGAPCIVYGETARSVQGDQGKPLATKPVLDDDEMAAYGRKMTAFAEWCLEQGMPLAYHHHMAAAIETEQELDRFMSATGQALGLLYDTGHLAFAGGDIFRAIKNHHTRITHVHTKDVRMDIVKALDRNNESFLDAVIKGAFTVPGDGSLDFGRVAQLLADCGYEGWFVVEAEQDPKPNPPERMAVIGRTELTRVLSTAGYTVED